MFKKILVPVDPANFEAAQYSLKLANRLVDDNGEISLFSVVENLPEDIIAELPGRFVQKSKNEIRHSLTKLAEENGNNTDVIVESGHPANQILQLSEDKNFDLVIVASHKPNLMNYLLGSTADRVVRKAKCPVFVTR